MSDRLQELLRQRAAIQAHLAWLDHEIAQARPTDDTAATAMATLPSPKTQETTPTPALAFSAPTSGTTINPDPDAILAGYSQDTQNLRTDLRKGCLLYFFAAFALLGFGVISFYFVNRLIRESDPAPSESRTVSPIER